MCVPCLDILPMSWISGVPDWLHRAENWEHNSHPPHPYLSLPRAKLSPSANLFKHFVQKWSAGSRVIMPDLCLSFVLSKLYMGNAVGEGEKKHISSFKCPLHFWCFIHNLCLWFGSDINLVSAFCLLGIAAPSWLGQIVFIWRGTKLISLVWQRWVWYNMKRAYCMRWHGLAEQGRYIVLTCRVKW